MSQSYTSQSKTCCVWYVAAICISLSTPIQKEQGFGNGRDLKDGGIEGSLKWNKVKLS